jgi:hypothetical protein
MRKKTDHSPGSEKDPAHASDADRTETDHYEPWSKLSEDDQDLKLGQFFKRWESPASDFEDCLPEAELRKAVAGRKEAEWPKHIQNCENCRSVAELLSDPNRVRIPVNRILAEASRRAWDVEHTGRRRSFTVEHVTSLFNSIPQPRRNRIFAGAAAVFVLTVVWVGVQYYQSKTPNPTVAFDNRPTPVKRETYATATDWFDKANEILGARNYTVEAKVLSLEPLQSSKPKVETTFNQANLDGSQRAQAGTLVAKYNSQVTVLKDSPNAQNLNTKDLPVQPTVDSEIVSKVWLAFGSSTGPIVFNREDSEAAKIILEAAKFTEVTNIEPKNQKTTVLITLPQDEFGEKDLNNRLESLKTQGIEVIVARYTAPRGPKSKLKAINAAP